MQVQSVKITKVTEVQEGTSKAGKDWKKLTFVGETEEQYNNLYAFEVFGVEKVENFQKFNKEGDLVDVDFNVNTREHEGRYYTSLSAWKVFKAAASSNGPDVNTQEDPSEELPF